MISCDLLGCHDRIVYTAVILLLLEIVIPHTAINSVFDSIQCMVHRARTLFRYSDDMCDGDSIEILRLEK